MRSLLSSILSSTRYNRSNLEINVGGKSMLRVIGQLRLYLDPTGFAAARIEVRAFNVVMIPAFAIETVCCSFRHTHMTRVRSLLSVLRKGLTYHDFVKDTSSRVRHLVKFVDAADTSIRENKGSTI